MIPATSCSAERSIRTLGRLKTYLPNTMEQQRVSNIAVIDIERAYANSVVNNAIDRIIDTFDRRNGSRTAISFNVFYGLYDRFICNIFTSYVH